MRDVNRDTVEGCSVAATGAECLVPQRVIDYADDHLSLVRQCNGDSEVGKAMGEVGGPVQRVDVPAIWALWSRHGRFFGQDLVRGKARAHHARDQGVGGFINIGDQIDDVGLDLNSFCLQPVGLEQGPGLVGSLLSDT